MTGRLKLLAVVAAAGIASAMWAASAGSSAAYEPVYGPPCAPAQCSPAPPCSPDGACWPKHDTWGWYPTRWRAFPGDFAGIAPTEADERRDEAEPEDAMGGPQPPDAARESQAGPDKPERGGVSVGPAGQVPGGAESAPAEGGAPADEAAPAAVPAPDMPLGPEDPLSSAAPTPPWLVEPAGAVSIVQPESVDPSHRAVAIEPTLPAAPSSPIVQDDAPPALPPGLRQAMNGAPAPIVPTTAAAPVITLAASPSLPSLSQPKSVTPSSRPTPTVDRRIVPASAVVPVGGAEPQGIQFINPAGALSTDAADGPQQAIYFEATDWASDQE